MNQVFALDPLGQSSEDLGTIGGEGLGPFGKIGESIARNSAAGGETGLKAVTTTISVVVGVMTIAAVIWFLFQFLTGGLFWITSGGDKAKLHEARERITNAFIGLLIVVAAWSILALAGQFFGFDVLISQPGTIIHQLNIPGK